MFDYKEEGESDMALSHLLTEENLRQNNRQGQLALLFYHFFLPALLSFCFIVNSIFYFVVLLFLFCRFALSLTLFSISSFCCFRFVVLHLKKNKRATWRSLICAKRRNLRRN